MLITYSISPLEGSVNYLREMVLNWIFNLIYYLNFQRRYLRRPTQSKTIHSFMQVTIMSIHTHTDLSQVTVCVICSMLYPHKHHLMVKILIYIMEL